MKPRDDERQIKRTRSNTEPYPSKRLGQHFLRDPRTVSRIINAFDPQPSDTVIEIGPGTGALTAELLKRAGRVIAVEFDRNLVPLLTETFKTAANFHLVQADALEVELCSLLQPASRARLAANLPYNISTAILQRLIPQRHCLSDLCLMLQKEVVERMLAPAGSSDRGFLSVLVEVYCESEKLFDVGPGAFRPPPKVWSSVVALRFRKTDDFQDEELFWSTVSAGFAQKRKTILNNLRNAPGKLQEMLRLNGGASIVLCKAGVELQRRAETLTVDEWRRIVNAMQ